MRNLLLLFTVLLITNVSVFAQEEETEGSGFEFSGFVDAYYQYNFNGEAPGLTSFTETQNSFTLGMAKVQIAKQAGKVGFVADLAFGPRADAANGYSGTTFGPVQQLFVTYAPSDAVTFTFGNFGTHVGYELIDSKDNFNYSTSYMFSYGPFYHTGLKADFALGDNFGAMVGIFNDTDSKFDFDNSKHIGAQLSYSGDAGDIYLNYLGGSEGSDTVSGNQIDLTAAFSATDDLTIGVNATSKLISDEVMETTSNWFGGALYFNYAVNDGLGLGLRGEYFSDADGAIFDVADLSIFELTLSANIKVDKLTIVPELRFDTASSDIFMKDGTATSTSPSFLVAFIYGF